MNINIDEASLT